MATVLIDTWWNVNAERYFKRLDFANGFNRYMVECEYRKTLHVSADVCSFNRYMVECESTLYMKNYQLENGFNRYMVECE